MKDKLLLVAIVLLTLLIGACGASTAPSSAPTTRGPLPPAPALGFDSQPGESAGIAQSKTQPAAQPAADGNVFNQSQSASDRLIIKTANLTLIVRDAEASLDAIKGITAGLGGFISNSQSTRAKDSASGVRVSMTLRVPADKYDDALKQIKQTAIRVDTERLGGQDITEEYTDLNARLRNLEATEKELLALMTTVREKSSRAEDILAVQRELNNIRGQIEQLKGRMQFLDRSVALATITLDLIPESLEGPVTTQAWDPARVARDAVRTLQNLLQGLLSVVIYALILVLPVAIVVGVPLALLVRWLRNRRRATVAAKP
ncbi:MAG: DUF4349 domain-containing protein [Chloroflexi bacterium]|nr:DUF4349 domain-containing protein [Chloroflexota bacterium]